MRGYTTREVSEILELPASRVRDWARRGLLEPERGPRGAFRFSFRDVVLLRAARELLDQRVSPRRVRAALEALRTQLPEGRPLSGVRISASGDRVVVHDADAVWEPVSGQLTLDFRVSEVATRAEPIARRGLDRPGAPASPTADDWYDTGLDLEAVSAVEAEAAYRRALEIDPAHAEAHLNLGRLLHESGEVSAALRHYRLAADASPPDARARFNAGVALEDLDRPGEAADAYRAAIELDPGLAPPHFNLSRLLEHEGRKAEALQHLAAYRRLQGAGGG